VSRFTDKLGRLQPMGPRPTAGEGVHVPPASPAAPAADVPSAAPSERVSKLREQIAALQAKQARTPEPRPAPPRGWADEADEARDEVNERAHDGAHGEPHRVHASESGLPGELSETAYGPLRSVVTPYPEDHQHGSVPVALALSAQARDLSILALDPSLESIDFTRALYIDTETTGLAGGAGTIPFLVGMAWFEGQKLIVEQLLLEKPGLEGPILRRLSECLLRASCVVSYNGKSFDWPLLRTRFILNRVPAPIVPAHLDLLHCARRVYKRRLGAVRLVHLEEQILGFTRVDDIPGALIPETYLGFLRGRVPASALRPIVEHNRSDLVALSAIMGELVRRFSAEHTQDSRDALSFAHVAARAEDHERAVGLAESAAESDVRGELAPQALFLAGKLHEKARALDLAIDRYLASIEAAAGDGVQAGPAQLALAKLFERKQRDLGRAIEHARHTACIEGDAACQARIARLTLRLQRAPSAARQS